MAAAAQRPSRLKGRGWALVVLAVVLTTASRLSAALPLTKSLLPAPDSSGVSSQLPHRYLDGSSLTLVAGANDTLQPGLDYRIDPTLGRITWLRWPGADSIRASYLYLPVSLPDTLESRSLLNALVVDSLLDDGETMTLLPTRDPFSQLARETSGLRRSGSVMRGVQIGSGRDVELQSGLSLQLEGELARGVNIRALLDDRSLPVQPEGTSRKLDEIDQVYVDIETESLRGRFGDYRLNYSGGRYGSIDRTLEGARVTWKQPDVEVLAAAAVTRTLFHTNSFIGSNGVQGPYPLTGRNGERDIIIAGGSEHVWLDGEELVRGENNDYTIDYNYGEITFMPRRPIDDQSRIVVDFEYSPETYPRNLYAGRVAASSPSGRHSIAISLFQESDDIDRPIGFDLDAEQRAALAGATGSSYALPSADSAGTDGGDYHRVDSTWTDGNSYSIFRFSPPESDGSPTGEWNVTFSQQTGGDYNRTYDALYGLYRFTWVGPGLGEYAPVRVIALPEQLRHASLLLTSAPSDRISFTADLGLSGYNSNTLSGNSSTETVGLAQSYSTQIRPLGGQPGQAAVELNAGFREEEAAYTPAARSKEVEYNRRWGLDSLSNSSRDREQNLSATLRPLENAQVQGEWAALERGAFTTSSRTSGGVSWNGELGAIKGDVERVESEETNLNARSDWLRSTLHLETERYGLRPTFDGRFEERDASSGSQWTGFKLSRARTGLAFAAPGGHSASLFARSGWYNQQSDSTLYRRLWDETGYGAEWEWRPSSLPLRNQFEFSLNKKEFSGSDSSDVTSRLAQWNAGFYPMRGALTAEWNYRLSRTVTRPRALIAYPVPQGQGDYIRVGDEYVYDPEIGDIILRTEPTGEAVPTTDVAAALSVDWSPHRLPGGAGQHEGFGWEDISLVTQIEAQDMTRSDEPTAVALLQPSSLLTDSSLDGQLTLRQDIYLFRNQRDLNGLLRYESNVTRTDLYGSGAERRDRDEWSLRVRSSLGERLDLENLAHWNRLGKQLARRTNGEHFELLDGSSELSWRSSAAWVYRLRLRGRIDHERISGIAARTLGIRPGLSYSLRERGRLTAELEMLWVESGSETLSYELAEGRAPGRNGRFSLRGDIRLGPHMTGRALYTLRMDQGRAPVHIARVEANAFF